MSNDSVNVENLKGKIIEYEAREGRSLWVKIFGLGYVEIEVSEINETHCIDLYVHPANQKGFPTASMRTFLWGVEAMMEEESKERQH